MAAITMHQKSKPHVHILSDPRLESFPRYLRHWEFGLFALLTVAACGNEAERVPSQGQESGSPSVIDTPIAGASGRGGAMAGGTTADPSPGGTSVRATDVGGGASIGVGGTATGGGTVGGSAGSGQVVACPAHAPTAGEPCETNLVCSYDDDTTQCARTSRARCVNAEWTVELPMDCPQTTSSGSSCDIQGTWAIEFARPSTELWGIPGPSKYQLTRDASGQYYVAPPPGQYAFTSWSFSSFAKCEVSASSRFDTIIPTSNGSNCGSVFSSCTLKLAFTGNSASGTIACYGNRPGCTSSLISWDGDATATRESP